MGIDLKAMAARGQAELSAANRAFNRRRSHPVREVIAAGARPFCCYTHYPEDEVEDRATGYFWYYHAHAPDERDQRAENGHFHLFCYASLVPPSAAPLASPQAGASGEARPFCHLLALSIDRHGVPDRMFTLNRWASGERLYPAPVLLPLVLRFNLGRGAGHAPVSRWLGAQVRAFAPQIDTLLAERDRILDTRRRLDPGGFAEDRAVEILSTIAFD